MSLLADPDYAVFRMRQLVAPALGEQRELISSSVVPASLYVVAAQNLPEPPVSAAGARGGRGTPAVDKGGEAFDPYAVYKRSIYGASGRTGGILDLPRKPRDARTPALSSNAASPPLSPADPPTQLLLELDPTLWPTRTQRRAAPANPGHNGRFATVPETDAEDDDDDADPPVVMASVEPSFTRAPTTDAKPSRHARSKSPDAKRRPREAAVVRRLGTMQFPKTALRTGGVSDSLDSLSDEMSEALTPTHRSILSNLIKQTMWYVNPFGREYAVWAAPGEPDALRLQILLPFSAQPQRPLQAAVQKDALVEDVIGYVLFQYSEERRLPEIPTELCSVVHWNLRLVDDDGEIEEDFPALDRARRMQKFCFESFALCRANDREVQVNQAVHRQLQALKARAAGSKRTSAAAPPQASNRAGRTSSAAPPGTSDEHAAAPDSTTTPGGPDASSSTSEQPAGTTANKGHPVILKVHLYSTLEVKQTTMLTAYSGMRMQEVFEMICSKKKYNPRDYVLKMADTRIDVPLDRELGQLGATEFCVLKRQGGAGDIFLRPPEELQDDEEALDNAIYAGRGANSGFLLNSLASPEATNRYKQYTLIQKQLMGRHERLFTIDGDVIQVAPPENRHLFDMMKTASHHINAVVSCRQTRANSPFFKLVVAKGAADFSLSSQSTNSGAAAPGISSGKDGAAASNAATTSMSSSSGISGNADTRVYDFEALSATEASEICHRIRFLLHQRDIRR